MTEHLPECLINRAYAVRVCICRQLSACEARVIAAAEADEMRCAEKVAAAYLAALRDAATWLRDSRHHPSDEAAAWAYAYAEAIDALKEKE